MSNFLLFSVALAVCLEIVTASPVPDKADPTQVVGPKPRCLKSILGYYAKKKLTGAMENFGGSSEPDFPGPGTLQGGMLSGSQGGFPSQNTPGLPSHALDAVKNAQLMNSQMGSMNSPQFAGVPGSGIPFSPDQFRYGMETFGTGVNSEMMGAGGYPRWMDQGGNFAPTGYVQHF